MYDQGPGAAALVANIAQVGESCTIIQLGSFANGFASAGLGGFFQKSFGMAVLKARGLDPKCRISFFRNKPHLGFEPRTLSTGNGRFDFELGVNVMSRFVQTAAFCGQLASRAFVISLQRINTTSGPSTPAK